MSSIKLNYDLHYNLQIPTPRLLCNHCSPCCLSPQSREVFVGMRSISTYGSVDNPTLNIPDRVSKYLLGGVIVDTRPLKGFRNYGHIYVQAEAAPVLSSVVLSLHPEVRSFILLCILQEAH